MPSLTQQNSAYRDNFRDARLLIIEDNPDHGVFMSQALKSSLPEVKFTIVSTEEEALDYLNECQMEEWKLPKLILLDLYLPEREHGWHVLQQIKSLPNALSKIPVVIFSSSDNRADVADAYERGCSSYMVKPVSYEQWLEYFQMLRTYWWETVTLPKNEVSMF